MIGMRPYDPIIGNGQKHLEQIGAEALLWRANAQHADSIRASAALCKIQGESVAGALVDNALREGTLGQLFVDLEELETQPILDIVRASVLRTAALRLKELKQGTAFDVYGRRAHVKIEAAGVMVATAFGDSHRGYFRRRERPAEVGEIFRGPMEEFNSAPAAGGRLQLGRFLDTAILGGLVDRRSGEPRVKMDIFMRRAKLEN